MPCGRPAKVDKHTIIDILMKYKDHLIVDGQKIVSKFDPIWATLAKELENRLTPISLYTRGVQKVSFPSLAKKENTIYRLK